jgi:hypothetical protein
MDEVREGAGGESKKIFQKLLLRVEIAGALKKTLTWKAIERKGGQKGQR